MEAAEVSVFKRAEPIIQPHFVIGNPAQPYLLRWFLVPRNRFFNVYLHCILRDDDDRALHDHPWFNISIILRGSYREVMPDKKSISTPHMRIAEMPQVSKERGIGSIVFRRATAAHRLEVARGPVWTLFITGPRIREWGFHCSWGWRHYKDFVSPHNRGEVGRGCEQ
jgi:hypothetical protein